MEQYTLAKEKLNVLLGQIAAESVLVAPVSVKEGVTLFRQVSSANEVAFGFDNTDVSPKGYFFPQTEKYLKFSASFGELEISEEAGDSEKVIFGMRQCDISAVASLDPVFGGKFPDARYQSKRDKTTVIGLSCSRVRPTCFCRAFGLDPCDGSGSDLMLTDAGDSYLVEIYTDKGGALRERYSSLFLTEGLAGAVEAKKELAEKLSGMFWRKVDLSGVKDVLDRNFELPVWEDAAKKCLGCGICTYVCPTCHCFDLVDHTRGGDSGGRYRCWDSCMFADFTRMAGGHNPRPSRKERVRNRFMHKLKYHLDRYNAIGCTGCGRCIDKCPVNIDITDIIEGIKGGEGR